MLYRPTSSMKPTVDPQPHAKTRRDIIQAGAAGLLAVPVAAMAALPLSAQAADAVPHPAPQGGGRPLADPIGAYPKPPFAKQQQEWPGLAAKMVPRPDHGEQSYRGANRLTGRKALITGGDSGIGRAAAIAFAREGADVAFGYLPAEESDAQEVVELIRAAGRKAVPLPGDIRDEAFCKRLVADAVAQLGGLDILVNNAGRQQTRAALDELTTADFDATFKTNVYAVFWITKAALAHLPPGAAIINTASEQAYDPSENLVDYAQTKSCNVSFTKSMAKQLAPKGIRVNAVAPGPIWTPLQPSGGQPPEKLPEFGEKTLWKRPGQPAELASTFVMLASAESTFTTAQVVGVTGGKPIA
jgi:NAD(P)-dependent dehydrogenase (short-subunit alcohol dehydrogenase family)